nr:diguanylate cyclase [Lachnospiraceae bacterium]
MVGFAIGYGVVIVVMLICIYNIRKFQSEVAKVLRRLLTIGVGSVGVGLVQIIVNNVFVLSVCSSLFYVSMVWICYELDEYISIFSNQRMHMNKVFRFLFLLVPISDTISMLLNPWLHHAADFQVVSYMGGTFLKVVIKPLYLAHMLLCYAMILDAIIRLILGFVKSSIVYRFQYVCVGVTLSVVVFLDAVFVFSDMIIDVSLVLFALAAVILTYFSLYYIPGYLRTRMQSLVFEQMKTYTFVFDNTGRCVYKNHDFADSGLKEDATLEECQEFVRKNSLRYGELCIEVGGRRKVFELDYNDLKDGNENVIGCYYRLEDVTRKRKEKGTEHKLAKYDMLTGVYNRQFFMEMASTYMHQNREREYVIVCSDIRHFKAINDSFGTDVGDLILKAIAQKLIEGDDKDRVYGRIGDDSFAICMPKDSYSERYFFENAVYDNTDVKGLYPVESHIGVYEVEDIDIPVTTMCDRAMLALRTIQNDFQKKIAYYDTKLRQELIDEQDIIKDFILAVEEDQFEIYLQPQINHKTREITGTEALV